MSAKQSDLSRRERQIMEVVYRLGSASAADVAEHLPDAPSYTTVRTLLRILEEKGFLAHSVKGKKYIYRSTTPRSSVGRSALARLLTIYFNGSLPSAIAAHLNDPRAVITDDELDAIERMIDVARRKAGKDDTRD